MAVEFSYRNYFDFDSKIMAMYGGILPDTMTARSQKIFKLLWILIVILIALPINIFLCGYIVVHIKSLSEVVECIAVFPFLFATIKFYYAASKRKEIEQLYTTIFTEEAFRPKNEKEDQIAVEALLIYRILKYVFLIIAQVGIVVFMFNGVEKTQYLPLLGWYPIDVSMSPFYEIALMHQVFACVTVGNVSMVSETIMTGFISFIALQCDLICHRLENLKRDDQKTLIEIIEVHKKVLSFVEKLETTFGPSYFGQFLGILITIAMFLFMLGKETTSTFQFITLLLYISIIYFLLLLPCWFTSELTRRSELIAAAAFKSSWVESSNSFKKNLIYFMQVSQKPITISIFGFFPISLQTALKVIQTSFSYYTMLKKLNK